MDFISIPQRPFGKDQKARTEEENDVFNKALQVMTSPARDACVGRGFGSEEAGFKAFSVAFSFVFKKTFCGSIASLEGMSTCTRT